MTRLLGKRLFLVLSIALGVVTLVGSTGFAAELDVKQSKIEFTGKKADGKHDGGFKKFAVKADLSADRLSSGTIEITIDTVSLWSDNAKLTNHLKNPDFFNVRKYPKITFQSSAIKPASDGRNAVVSGKLTMLGKTNDVEVPITVSEAEGALNVTATFKIDRMKWGMTYGKGNIKDEVDITASLVFEK